MSKKCKECEKYDNCQGLGQITVTHPESDETIKGIGVFALLTEEDSVMAGAIGPHNIIMNLLGSICANMVHTIIKEQGISKYHEKEVVIEFMTDLLDEIMVELKAAKMDDIRSGMKADGFENEMNNFAKFMDLMNREPNGGNN